MQQPLGEFMPIWKGNNVGRWFAKRRKRKPAIVAPEMLRDLWRWTVHGKDGTFTKHGMRFQELYENFLDLEDPQDWYFERPLGQGSFGVAALFYKSGKNGERLDDVVVKTAYSSMEMMVYGGLSDEAAIMCQVLELQNDSLVVLRHYKYLDSQPKLRYYLEHYENGDLNRLQLRYKAWQRRLPEAFLWHLFRDLVVGACEPGKSLATGTFRSLDPDDFGSILKNAFIDHKDIKLENTFLGKARPDGGPPYSRAVIADFGLSEILTPFGEDNTARDQAGGSPAWRAPEARVDDMENTRFIRPFVPKGEGIIRRGTVIGGHKLTPAVNVWPIGAMMWSLLTGQDILVLDDLVFRIFSSKNWRFAPHTIDTIVTDPENEYSIELRELIRDCLKLRPGDRPTPTALRTRVEQCYIQIAENEKANFQRDPQGTVDRIQVWDIANEIQQLPLGNANFDLDERFWNRFVEDQMWLPPEWGPCWPPNVPDNVKAPEHWPYQIKLKFQQLKEQAEAAEKEKKEKEQEEKEKARLAEEARLAEVARLAREEARLAWERQRQESPDDEQPVQWDSALDRMRRRREQRAQDMGNRQRTLMDALRKTWAKRWWT